MAMPWMAATGMPRVWRNVSMTSPYSSAVCSRRLVMRHEVTRRGPSNTPIFVLVLPTSATSSMRVSRGHLVRCDLAGNDPPDSFASVDQERAVGVEVRGGAGDAVHRDLPADRVAEALPALADEGEALPFQPRAPRIELLEQGRQERLAIDGAPGLEGDGRRPPCQLRRKLALAEIDAHADDQDGLRRRDRARLEEDAGHLPAVDEDVVRPLQPGRQRRDAPQRLRRGDRGHRRQGRQEPLRPPGADQEEWTPADWFAPAPARYDRAVLDPTPADRRSRPCDPRRRARRARRRPSGWNRRCRA